MLHANAVPVPNRTKREAELLKVLGVDATKLTLEQRDELAQLVIAYQDVFALEGEELGTTSAVNHVIDTQQATPIKQYARRVLFAMRGRVEELVAEMLRRGVVQPTKSPWASPVILVAKKDGGTRTA